MEELVGGYGWEIIHGYENIETTYVAIEMGGFTLTKVDTVTYREDDKGHVLLLGIDGSTHNWRIK